MTENDIVCVEEFVQKELEQRILDRCARLGSDLDENEKESFFGIYAGSIKDFKFLRGERIQILGLAENLRAMFIEKGKEQFSKHFEIPENFKIDKSGTHNFSFGWFYGQKPRKSVQKSVFDIDHLKTTLVTKLMETFQSFGLKPNQPITDDIIQIVDFGTGFRGDVVCVCCPINEKKHAIQYDKTKRWNLTNFRKHLKIHVKNELKDKVETKDISSVKLIDMPQSTPKIKTEPSKSTTLESKEEPIVLDESSITKMPIFLEDFGFNFEEVSATQKPSLTNIMYAQFSNQNLRLIEATLANSERKKFMVLKVENRCMNVNIVNIDADGNCLFGTVAHQLEYMQVNSAEHIERTTGLREQVVNHIEEHFETYKHVIQLRIRCEDDQIDNLGKTFLKNNLSANGFWAGSESLLAISNMFNVNILVFMENGPFYLSTGFNPDKNRTIFLAFRQLRNTKGELDYNHYESVCEVDPELLFKCALDLRVKMEITEHEGVL